MIQCSVGLELNRKLWRWNYFSTANRLSQVILLSVSTLKVLDISGILQTSDQPQQSPILLSALSEVSVSGSSELINFFTSRFTFSSLTSLSFWLNHEGREYNKARQEGMFDVIKSCRSSLEVIRLDEKRNREVPYYRGRPARIEPSLESRDWKSKKPQESKSDDEYLELSQLLRISLNLKGENPYLEELLQFNCPELQYWFLSKRLKSHRQSFCSKAPKLGRPWVG